MSSSIHKSESTTESAEQAINKVKTWLDEVVIQQNFCPYAKEPRTKEQIRFSVSDATDIEALLAALSQELKKLDDEPDIATTLIIIESYLADFYDYLDALELAQGLLEQLDYEGIYQVASFHPDYYFEGESPDSASHYTNRSPYPIFHIIREQDIAEVVKRDDIGDKIAQRNIKHANQLGVNFFKRYLS